MSVQRGLLSFSCNKVNGNMNKTMISAVNILQNAWHFIDLSLDCKQKTNHLTNQTHFYYRKGTNFSGNQRSVVADSCTWTDLKNYALAEYLLVAMNGSEFGAGSKRNSIDLSIGAKRNSFDIGGISTKRNSIDTDELVKRIHASKPKSVFLDSKPNVTAGHKYAFGKSSKIGDQALQTIKRAAFATETNDEVYWFSFTLHRSECVIVLSSVNFSCFKAL